MCWTVSEKEELDWISPDSSNNGLERFFETVGARKVLSRHHLRLHSTTKERPFRRVSIQAATDSHLVPSKRYSVGQRVKSSLRKRSEGKRDSAKTLHFTQCIFTVSSSSAICTLLLAEIAIKSLAIAMLGRI